MNQKDFASSKVFIDAKNFPRGFSRSGIFSKKEADILERCGAAMNELTNGNRQAGTEVEERFVDMVRGATEPETLEEKVWAKYMRHVNTPRVAYTTGMAFAMADSSDSSDMDVD